MKVISSVILFCKIFILNLVNAYNYIGCFGTYAWYDVFGDYNAFNTTQCSAVAVAQPYYTAGDYYFNYLYSSTNNTVENALLACTGFTYAALNRGYTLNFMF